MEPVMLCYDPPPHIAELVTAIHEAIVTINPKVDDALAALLLVFLSAATSPLSPKEQASLTATPLGLVVVHILSSAGCAPTPAQPTPTRSM